MNTEYEYEDERAAQDLDHAPLRVILRPEVELTDALTSQVALNRNKQR
jgi:hypothetical protein